MLLNKIDNNFICPYCDVCMNDNNTSNWQFCNKCGTCFLLNAPSNMVRTIFFKWANYVNRVECHLYINKTVIFKSNKPIIFIDSIFPEMTPDNVDSICERLLKSKAFI